MVVKEEKQRLHRLLADAIPLLCKSGLPPKATFCIEALIGITLEDDEVLLVSFKQEIRADEMALPDNCFETVAIETEEEEEETGIKTTGNKSRNMAARKKPEKQTEQLVDTTAEVKVNRIERKKISSAKDGDISSVPARVKLEVVDIKMEDDVEMISTADASGYGYSGEAAADGLAWNVYKHDPQASSVSASFVDEAVDGGEEEAARGKWNISGRLGNKTGRRRTGRTAPSSSLFSNPSNECTYATADGSTSDWNRKRKDGRNLGTAAASHNSSSISLMNDPGLGCQVFEPSVAAQDSSVGQSISDPQPLDDRVSLEQTCKILSAYRFASSDDNLYSCHICEAKLRGRQTLYEHIRGTHLCAHIYRCPNCGLSFKWRSGLQRHRTRCPNNGSAQVLTPPVIDM